MKKKILIFTGGGLAPALNATLYGVISSAQKNKLQVLGGMFGWACLGEEGKIIDLTNTNIEPIKNTGGTFLRSSRTDPYKLPKGIKGIKKRIKDLDIDYIIAIGGNDTLGAASRLAKDGVAIIGVPKTVDNDIPQTYFSPGFASAAHYISNFCNEIREDAAFALSRIYIVEIMGADSGWLTAASSYGNADVIIPPEKQVDLKNLLKIIKKRYNTNGKFATVAVAQHANFGKSLSAIEDDQKDEYGTKRPEFIGLALRDKIKKELNINTKLVAPGNYAQTGPPIDLDRKLGQKLGKHAVRLLQQGKTGYMVNITNSDGKLTISDTELNSIDWKKLKILDNTYFDFDKYQVKKKFLNYMKPILGKYKNLDSNYWKLIKKINK